MLDRTLPPPFQENNSLDILNAEITDLPNGIRIYSISGGLQDVIKIELLIRAGRWYESKIGAAQFAGALLSKGAASKSSFDIARIFDLYGAHLEVNAGLDVVSVSLYTLTKNLEPVLSLLYEVTSAPSYSEKELDQSKSVFLQNLKVNQEKTSFLASKQFRKTLFGENHPYGIELDENAAEISSSDLIHHYQEHFRDFFMIVSGKLDPKTSGLIADAFSTFPFKRTQNIDHKTITTAPAHFYNEKEGSIQSSVRVGKRMPGRGHKDYFSIVLLNHILGGYFGSRLMKNIREEKGYTYGIYSSINTLIHDSYHVIGADVNKENLGSTFDEIRMELGRLRSETIPMEELNTARNHFLGSLQSEITTPFSHADKWKNIILYQLPESYYTDLVNKLTSVTPDELIVTADQYFREDSFFEVAVG